MKYIYITILIIFIIGNAFSQYYYIPYMGLEKNPGGLNTDNENGTPSGWTTILAGAQPAGTYSAAQTIPFSFSFNGNAVTKYKVSNSGILTFDVNTAISPGTANVALPSALVPDSAVCVWGISGSGANDNIVTKTFGTAPNRQHWIFFTSYTSGTAFTYWSIVLEETTNNIYIVDQRSGGTVSGLTLGIQINSTTATQVAGSPNVNGLAADNYKQSDNVYYTFIYGTQPSYDLEMQKIHTAIFPNLEYAPYVISGTVRNLGTTAVNSFDINYSVNGGTVVTTSINSLNITTLNTYRFTHSANWNPSASGTYTVNIWASNINGNVDQDSTNNVKTPTIIVSDTIPNIIGTYLTNVPIYNIIGTASNSLKTPSDIDFHPDLNRYELWAINYDTEANGGSTVTFYNASKGNQTSSYKKDGNSWHFMSLPTGIAFSDNGNFANSPGVYDANHNGGAPFTGPSLWSSDPAIYAQPSGGNGSHLDMLHASPYCMGITHETENVFWAFDGNSNDIVRYDFSEGHGPGNEDHGNGIVRRFQVPVAMINNTIPSHLVLDKKTGKLYVADGGNARILRVDINSGTLGGTPTFPAYEPMDQYVNVTGVTWSAYINSGLVQPSGIDIIDNRLIVTDYSNGDIIIYDISGTSGVELGRVKTGTPGITGVTIGPDGYIWYVNKATQQVIRVTLGGPLSMQDNFLEAKISIYPNPSNYVINIVNNNLLDIKRAEIYNIMGEKIRNISFQQELINAIDISELTAGTYFIRFETMQGIFAKRFQKTE